MTRIVAGYAQTLLRHLLEHVSSFTVEQFAAAGKTARQVLAFAWDETTRNSWLVTNAVRAVSQTFSTNPGESAVLLRRAIKPDHLALYGYEEMPVITRELGRIAGDSPDLVADIYAAVFSYEEASADTTNMSGSQILSLTSNKTQDYNLSRWQLAEYYSTFVKQHPVLATETMIKVIDVYRARKHSTQAPPEAFTVNGLKASILHDFSYIWDEGFASHHDNEIRILDQFFRQFEEYAKDPADTATVDQILTVLMSGARPAVIWRRLLKLAAGFPKEIGLKIRSLALVAPLMWVPDTEVPTGDFLTALFPLLEIGERQRIEEVIVSLPASVPEKIHDAVDRDRARLLAALAKDLVTEGAKQILRELEEAKKIPAPHQHGPRFKITTGSVDERVYLEEILGVSTESEPHKEFLQLNRPVREFNAKQAAKTPSTDEIEAVLPHIKALHAVLSSALEGVDDKLLTMASGDLAAACKTIANTGELSCGTLAGDCARNILLEMSKHPSPEYDPADDAAFDATPSWGAPLARIEAAVGLMAMARHASCCFADVLDAIDRLSGDEAPAVRYQIAANLTLLYATAQDRMWKLFESRAGLETSNGVLAALSYSVSHLTGTYPSEAANLVHQIFKRVNAGAGAEDVKTSCVQTFVRLYIWRNRQSSEEFVYGLCQDVRTNHQLLSGILFMLRGPLIEGDVTNPKAADEEIRSRAVELFNAIAAAACDALSAVMAEFGSSDSETGQELVKSLARLVDQAAQQLSFASGAFRDPSVQQQVSVLQQKRFYEELTPTIDRLSKFGFASTVHHLIEMLQYFIPFDPRRVFLQVTALVERGKDGNYQYESMGVGHIVLIVERYLAEYRSLLQEDAECRVALRQMLDSFVEAGWPAAQRLTYRLDEIFR